MFLAMLLYGCLGWIAWSIICLEVNAHKARGIGIPYIRIPFDVNNNLWVVVQPWIWKLLARLPFQWPSYPDFVRFSHRNWHFLEKSSPTSRFGQVWALVSPGGVHMHFADPDAIQSIFSRWRQFVRPVQKYQMLAIYGPSIFTVELDDWPRHRKAVVAPFHEKTMNHVWLESLRQTRSMLKHWTDEPTGGILNLKEDLITVSLNILASTAFHESYEFVGSKDWKNHETNPESYRDALHTVHKHAILLMLLPYRYLTGPLIPKRLAVIGRAARNLKEMMTKVTMDEMQAVTQGQKGSGGIITSLVRAFDQTLSTKGDTMNIIQERKRGRGLSVDEILGNIFVINFAGHDTTPNALSFTIMLLAANPKVQDWLREEIAFVTEKKPSGLSEYNVYQDLKRCQAVFLETLRLYAPITGLPKITCDRAQVLNVAGRAIHIPSGVETFPLLLGVQSDPLHWVDPYVWRPSRWVLCSEDSSNLLDEELVVPQKGTYFPWSEGPQACPGKKFSQVEAVAVLACLFQDHKIQAKSPVGKTAEDSRRTVQACVDDVNYHLLLQMNHPERVQLQCVKAG